MKILVSAVVVTLLCSVAGSAHAGKCVGLEQLTDKKPGLGKRPALLEQVRAAREAAPAAPKVDCDSLVNVYKLLVNGARRGGRKLEDDKPLDSATAQANLDEALQNPEIRAQLDELQHDVADEDVRMLYEAAVLDAEGFYDARALRIQQLREKLGD